MFPPVTKFSYYKLINENGKEEYIRAVNSLSRQNISNLFGVKPENILNSTRKKYIEEVRKEKTA